MTRSSSLLLAALALGALSCREPSAPPVQTGSVTAAVYIDRDGSGTLTAGDSTLANVEVALRMNGQTVATERTGADGLATFTGLGPGGYQLQVVGPQPAGSVLTSNPVPTAAIDVRGTPARVDFRYAFFPGRIAGRVFRDDNSTGEYDAEHDRVAVGLRVFLRRDVNGAAGDTIATASTNAEGIYSFGAIAPGRYWLEFENPGSLDFGEAGRVRRIDVGPDAETGMNAIFTGLLIIPISEARARPVGAGVEVRGAITTPPGSMTNSTGNLSEIWVQDATGGIASFPIQTADSARFPLGQVVEVVGPIVNNSGQIQIGTTTTPPIVTAVAGETMQITPIAQTAKQANQRINEGRLITVTNLRIIAIPTGTGGAFNIDAIHPDGDTLRIRIHGASTGITRQSFTAGAQYTITGVLSQFSGRAQLKPRFASDVVLIPEGEPLGPRVIINEFIADPTAVGDNVGEWLELHNWGDQSIDIQGWRLLGNSSGDTATIQSSVVIPAGGYVVMGRSGDVTLNGGVAMDYVYGMTYSLNNSGNDRIVLKNTLGETVDSVFYGHQPPIGAALGVRDPSADHMNATSGAQTAGPNWQVQTTTFGGASDRGTPRAQNDGYIAPTSSVQSSVAPATRSMEVAERSAAPSGSRPQPMAAARAARRLEENVQR